jgi:hypothetical protein
MKGEDCPRCKEYLAVINNDVRHWRFEWYRKAATLAKLLQEVDERHFLWLHPGEPDCAPCELATKIRAALAEIGPFEE